MIKWEDKVAINHDEYMHTHIYIYNIHTYYIYIQYIYMYMYVYLNEMMNDENMVRYGKSLAESPCPRATSGRAVPKSWSSRPSAWMFLVPVSPRFSNK
jgi:hypothetical protein